MPRPFDFPLRIVPTSPMIGGVVSVTTASNRGKDIAVTIAPA